MAILFQVSQFVALGRLPGEHAPLIQLPPLLVSRFVSAGTCPPFEQEARSFRIRNLGDPVWFAVVETDSGLQAGDNSWSEWLESGDIYDFMTEANDYASNWQIDVRAR